MQWFKSAMVVSSILTVAAAFSVEGCSTKNPEGGDGGDSGIVSKDGNTKDVVKTGDGGGSCTSGLSCEICDVSGFSVSPQAKPIGPKSGACTTAQITSFDTACLATAATQATCSTWEQANTACSACLVTKTSDASWGPLVCDQTCSINVPGCIDLALGQVSTENGTNGSCGDLLNANYECQDYACGACDVAADGGTDPASFQTCDNAALQAECKSYSDAFDNGSQCSALQGDTLPTSVQVCFASDPNSGFSEQEVVNISAYFCGPAN